MTHGSSTLTASEPTHIQSLGARHDNKIPSLTIVKAQIVFFLSTLTEENFWENQGDIRRVSPTVYGKATLVTNMELLNAVVRLITVTASRIIAPDLPASEDSSTILPYRLLVLETQRLARDPFLADYFREAIDKADSVPIRNFELVRFIERVAPIPLERIILASAMLSASNRRDQVYQAGAIIRMNFDQARPVLMRHFTFSTGNLSQAQISKLLLNLLCESPLGAPVLDVTRRQSLLSGLLEKYGFDFMMPIMKQILPRISLQHETTLAQALIQLGPELTTDVDAVRALFLRYGISESSPPMDPQLLEVVNHLACFASEGSILPDVKALVRAFNSYNVPLPWFKAIQALDRQERTGINTTTLKLIVTILSEARHGVSGFWHNWPNPLYQLRIINALLSLTADTFSFNRLPGRAVITTDDIASASSAFKRLVQNVQKSTWNSLDLFKLLVKLDDTGNHAVKSGVREILNKGRRISAILVLMGLYQALEEYRRIRNDMRSPGDLDQRAQSHISAYITELEAFQTSYLQLQEQPGRVGEHRQQQEESEDEWKAMVRRKLTKEMEDREGVEKESKEAKALLVREEKRGVEKEARRLREEEKRKEEEETERILEEEGRIRDVAERILEEEERVRKEAERIRKEEEWIREEGEWIRGKVDGTLKEDEWTWKAIVRRKLTKEMEDREGVEKENKEAKALLVREEKRGVEEEARRLREEEKRKEEEAERILEEEGRIREEAEGILEEEERIRKEEERSKEEEGARRSHEEEERCGEEGEAYGILELTGQVHIIQRESVYQGPYSTVYKGIWCNEAVAVKVIRAAGTLKTTRRKLRRETEIWAKLRHPNILPMYGLCLDDQWEYGALISPWCINGKSSDYLYGLVDKPEERIRLLTEVAKGTEFLHAREPIIVHGDLKPANVLIDGQGTARICDFGLIRIIQEEVDTGMTTTTPHTGTTRYLSRELLTGETPAPTLASDCHALGCIILEFAYLKLPYASHQTVWKIQTEINNREPPCMRLKGVDGHDGHNLLWNLLEACWDLDPDSRPASAAILNYLLAHGDVMIEALSDSPSP
ncbi:hypothetical protein FRC17_004884 [Serendipita sp. 399]|nr:hypothetical protein FRC17_004884 [Serendipita sp. 399]